MPTLTDIFEGKYTDKVKNGIAPVYDRLFAPIREDVRELLEIGVDKGGSIEGWLEYFPNATIHGYDMRPSGFRHKRYREWIGNIRETQMVVAAFENVKLDIVIDDGSHWNADIIAAFEILWPFVTPGGYYCIEDIQVPFRSHALPRTEAYFTNFAEEHELEYDIPRYNLMWLRKDS